MQVAVEGEDSWVIPRSRGRCWRCGLPLAGVRRGERFASQGYAASHASASHEQRVHHSAARYLFPDRAAQSRGTARTGLCRVIRRRDVAVRTSSPPTYTSALCVGAVPQGRLHSPGYLKIHGHACFGSLAVVVQHPAMAAPLQYLQVIRDVTERLLALPSACHLHSHNRFHLQVFQKSFWVSKDACERVPSAMFMRPSASSACVQSLDQSSGNSTPPSRRRRFCNPGQERWILSDETRIYCGCYVTAGAVRPPLCGHS